MTRFGIVHLGLVLWLFPWSLVFLLLAIQIDTRGNFIRNQNQAEQTIGETGFFAFAPPGQSQPGNVAGSWAIIWEKLGESQDGRKQQQGDSTLE